MFQTKLLREALRRYAGEHVLARVLREGDSALSVGADSRVMTVMWVEMVVDKARLSSLDPTTIARLRVDYWSAVIRTIEKNDGVFDNYFGDDIMAYFGVRDGVNHAALALTCAMRVISATRQLDRPNPLFSSKIGIETGLVFLGNMGAPERIKFTVMGDVVNLVSRLAGRANDYGTQILLTSEVVEAANEAAGIPLTWVGDVGVVQRKEPVKLFSPVEALTATANT